MAQQCRIPGVEGGDEELELGAGVVYVELALHVVARRLQHVGQRIAQHGVARPAVVDGAGGIGADKLDLPALPRPRSMFPNAGPASTMAGTCCCSHASARRRLMKPGPAISTCPIGPSWGMCSTMIWAIARGLAFPPVLRTAAAATMATLVL